MREQKDRLSEAPVNQSSKKRKKHHILPTSELDNSRLTTLIQESPAIFNNTAYAANPHFFQTSAVPVAAQSVNQYIKNSFILPNKLSANYELKLVKIWDINLTPDPHFFSYCIESVTSNTNELNNAVPFESGSDRSGLRWRPAIWQGRRLPWYQRINWSGVDRVYQEVIAPKLAMFDLASSFYNEIISYPDHHLAANCSALSMNISINYGTSAYLTTLSNTYAATGALLVLNSACKIAETVCQTPSNHFNDNKDFLEGLILLNDFSPQLESFLLNQFSDRESANRFAENSINALKQVYLPFDLFNKAQQKLIDAARYIGNLPYQLFSFPEVSRAIMAKADRTDLLASQTLNRESLVARDDLSENPPSFFSANQSQNNFDLKDENVNFALNNTNRLHYIFSVGDQKIAAEIYQKLEKINRKQGDKYILFADYPNEDKYHSRKQELSLNEIAVGSVFGGMGFIFTLANKETLTLAATRGSFFLSVSNQFGANFWSAFSGLTGLGTIITSLGMIVLYFRNHLKLQRLRHEIHKRMHTTQKELAKIRNKKNELDNRALDDIPQSIDAANQLIDEIRKRIIAEEKETHFAMKKRFWKARDNHMKVSHYFHNLIQELNAKKQALKLIDLQRSFIAAHQDKEAVELIDLVRTLTGKTKYSNEDVALINAARQLLLSKMLALVAMNAPNEATQLFAATADFSFYSPGLIPSLNIQGLGFISLSVQEQIKTINNAIDNINSLMGEGKDPRSCMTTLVNTLSGFITDWEYQLKHRGSHRKKESHVSKPSWQLRIQALTELKNWLTQEVQSYDPSQARQSLNLHPLGSLLESLQQNREMPVDFWLAELRACTTNEKNYSQEEAALFKIFAWQRIIKTVVDTAIDSKFTAAKELILALENLLPEHQELTQRYTQKLEELKQNAGADLSFWFARIQQLVALNIQDQDEITDLELSIAKQSVLNEIFQQVITGQFTSAIANLKQLNDLLSNLADFSSALIAKIDELSLHWQNSNYYLECLRKSYAKEVSSAVDFVEQAILHQLISNEILSAMIHADLPKADHICQQYQAIAQENGEKIALLRQVISELSLLKVQGSQSLFNRINSLQQINSIDRNEKDLLMLMCLRSWLINQLLCLVNENNFQEARNYLDHFQQCDPSQTAMIIELKNTVVFAEQNKQQNDEFWQEEYDSFLAMKKEEMMEHQATILSFRQAVIIRALLNLANKRAQLGYNREAAEIVSKLQMKDPSLALTEISEDYQFYHYEQLLSVFMQPLETAVFSYVRGMKESGVKRGLTQCFKLLQEVQIIVPNVLALTAQTLFSMITGGEKAAVRHLGRVFAELKQDLNPKNLLNDYQNTSILNALITHRTAVYTQFFLKFIQHAPLDYLPLPMAIPAEIIRQEVVGLGQLTLQSISLFKAASRFFVMDAYTPINWVNLISASINLLSWGYTKYVPGGEEIDDPSYYTLVDGIQFGLQTLGAALFIHNITTSDNFAFATLFGVGSLNIYNLFAKANEKERFNRPINAAINNLHYHQNINAFYHYIKSCSYRLVAAELTPNELTSVKNASEIIITQKNKHYFLHFIDVVKKKLVFTKITRQQVDFKSLFAELTRQNQSSEKLKDPGLIRKLQIFLLKMTDKSPATQVLCMNADFMIFEKGSIRKKSLLINTDNDVFFVRESADSLALMYMPEKDDYRKIPILNPEILNNFPVVKELIISSTDKEYDELLLSALELLITDNLLKSRKTIKHLLQQYSVDISYNESDFSSINVARLSYVYQTVKDCYEQGKYEKVFALTNLIKTNNHYVINCNFRLPAHLSWQIINYRLLTVIEVDLLNFHSQYQLYSEAIQQAAANAEDWQSNNWGDIKHHFTKMVTMAIEKCLIFAENSQSEKDKKQFLAAVTKNYNCCPPWHELIHSDELRWLAAILFYQGQQAEQVNAILSRLTTGLEFILKENNPLLTEQALTILYAIKSPLYQSLLNEVFQDSLVLNAQTKLDYFYRLTVDANFTQAAELLKYPIDFKAKKTAFALYSFYVSDRKEMAKTLDYLAQETTDTRYFWILLHQVLAELMVKAEKRPLLQKELAAIRQLCGENSDSYSSSNNVRYDSLAMQQIVFRVKEIYYSMPNEKSASYIRFFQPLASLTTDNNRGEPIRPSALHFDQM